MPAVLQSIRGGTGFQARLSYLRDPCTWCSVWLSPMAAPHSSGTSSVGQSLRQTFLCVPGIPFVSVRHPYLETPRVAELDHRSS